MIEIIAGTNRPGSNTLKVANLIEKLYRDLGVEAQVLSLELMPPEIFDPQSYAKKPESWKRITDRVVNADGLHIVTPEYNGGFPGVLKYFIDMLPFPESFEHRCVCFTGHAAGIWGAFRPVEQLQMIFGYRNAYILPERVWFTQIHTRLDDHDQLLHETDRKLLADQVHKFSEFVKRFRS
jgi:NAD(P)H-dependent FMN reductase